MNIYEETATRIADVLTEESFIQDHWMKSPKVFPADKSLAAVLNEEHPRVWVKYAAVYHPDKVCEIIKGMSRSLTRAMSHDLARKYILAWCNYRVMILYDFQLMNEFYRELTAALASRFSKHCDAGMFVSLKKHTGLNKHVDSISAFIFQHTGTAKWKIYNPKEWDDLIFEHDLKPGEVLFVPKGLPHEVIRKTSCTSHVTVALSY